MAGVTNLGASNYLDELMGSHYGRTGGYMLMAPQYRQIVTATDKDRILQPLPALGINPMADEQVRADNQTVIGTTPQGVAVLTAVATVPVAAWRLVVELPTEEAFAPIRAIQERLLLTTLLLTVLAGGLIWLLLARELAPMLTASRALNHGALTDEPIHSC